jgi:hypothetical protein
MTASTTTAIDWPTSHLRAAELAFTALTCPPEPLCLDCTRLDGAPAANLGLPAGLVPLGDLNAWLRAHRTCFAARDAVWRELLGLARSTGGVWLIAATGLAMPALRRFAGRLARGYTGDPADLDNEILTGFLEAVKYRVDPDRDRLAARLCWAGYRAGLAARHAQDADTYLEDLAGEPAAPPHLPYAHPDLLLARAAAIGLIDRAEAELILQTRLEDTTIEKLAASTGLDPAVLRMRRVRAERRLVQGIRDGHLSGPVSMPVRQRLTKQATARAAARTSMPRPAAAA